MIILLSVYSLLLAHDVDGRYPSPCPPKCSQVACDVLQNDVGVLQNQVALLEEENAVLESDVNSLNSSLSELQDRFEDLNNDAQEINSSLADLREYYESLESYTIELKANHTELLDCFNELDQAVRCWMGMKSGGISDTSISASSTRNANFPPQRARLDTIRGRGSNLRGAWCPDGSSMSPSWIEVDFGEPKEVAGIITQGRHDANEWVTEYFVECGDETGSLVAVNNLGSALTFTANTDRNSYVYNKFEEVVTCQSIRILPQDSNGSECMRFELVRGKCYDEYSEYMA